MSFFRRFGVLALASTLSTSCLSDQDNNEPLAQYRAEISTNSPTLNGISINGISINGISINGISINGISINGISINGISINGISINGISINGTALDGLSLTNSKISLKLPGTNKTLTGRDLIGMTAKISVPAQGSVLGQTYTMRIDNVVQDTSNNFNDIWLYQVSYKADNSNSWQSLCSDYSGQPSPLTLVKGAYWNETTGARIDDAKAVTPACAEGAIGKCVILGYRPWATGSVCNGYGRHRDCNDVSLKEYHQACTRMIRADYCGDGTAHTVNGTILDIFDYLSPPVQLQEEKWQMEARWTQTGALCLSQRRHPEIPFPGCVKSGDKSKTPTYVQPPKCQAYSTGDDRGLIVSTFQSGTK